MTASAKRRVLMASWLFPPHGSIGAKRAWRFARHLPENGWSPTVVCRRRVPDDVSDPSDWSLPAEVHVERTYDAAIFSRIGAMLSGPSKDATPAATPLTRPRRAKMVDSWNRLVDAMVPGETAAIHAAHLHGVLNQLAPSHDVIWTTSYPYHAHLVGARVARRHGLPFVADLRDPWTPNWVHRQKFAFTRAIEARWERETFAAADAIVVTTESLAELYRSIYPDKRERFVVIRNAFEPDGAPTPKRSSGPRRIVHFGNVYGPWSLDTVLRALAALRREGAPGAADAIVENYGKLCDRDRNLARDLGLESTLRVTPPVPYTEGIARLREADLLVLAGWNDPDAGLYIQGKLFDYLLAGVDILAETASREITSIVRHTGAGIVIEPGDHAGAVTVLRRVLAGQGVGIVRDAEAISAYGSPSTTRQLADVLDRLVVTRRTR